MAPLTQQTCSFSKVLLVLSLVFILFASSFISAQSPHNARRRMLGQDIDDNLDDFELDSPKPIKKKTISSPNKNQTKLIKSTSNVSSKNQTKLPKISSFSDSNSIKNKTKIAKSKLSLSDSLSSSIKNQTKLAKTKLSLSDSIKNQTKLVKTKLSLSDSVSGSTKNKTKLIKPTPEEKIALKSQLKKLNSTSLKSTNSTKKTPDLSKTTKLSPTKPKNTTKTQSSTNKNVKKQTNWLDDDDDDLIAGFRDLPTKFQETLLPDLEKITKTSKSYLNRANKEITKNFKPFVGNKYAPTIASLLSFAFILVPLLLVSLIFNKIKAYFSLQRLLIFIQVYLSIYFSILCFSSLLTGLEPLKFFYATSQSTYICLQLLQTLAYVLYLLMLLMYLVLVFSTETGPVTKLIGLAQTFVGFAVGLHYYVTVFHMAVLRQAPKTSWKIHAIYATCFVLICLLTRAERIKKSYLEEGGEEGKKS